MRHLTAFTVALLAPLMFATACVSRQAAEDGAVAVPTTVPTAELVGVTLTVGDQKGGTAALLKASGALDGAPYRVDFASFTSGPPEVEAATANRIDFAVTGNTPPIFGAAQNARIRVVAGYTTRAQGDQILVQPDSTIASIADLKGKKVAVSKGSSAHGNLLLQLTKAGLTPADISTVYLQPADALAAFSAGQVDAWAIWDPYTAIAAQQTQARTLVTAEGVSNGYSFGIASIAALTDAKRNSALADLIGRIDTAQHWASTHLTEWTARYATEVGIDPGAASVAQQRSLARSIPLSEAVTQAQQKLANAFADSGQIDAKPDFASYVDTRFNSALKP